MGARAKFHADQAGLLTTRNAAERPVQGRTAVLRRTAVSPVLKAMTERQFQKQVTDALGKRGWIWWHVPNMRQTTAGLPDIIAIHAGRPVVLAWELKREGGKATPIQQAVINVMQGIPGVDARIIRPSDWAAVLEDLDR